MTDKITELPSKTDETKAAVDNMRRNMDDFIDMVRIVAQLKRAAYEEYVKQGFSEEQAIELCKGSIML